MLEGLDDIPWATMQHVYGKEDKVPIWIRDLTSSERDIRYKALLNLENTLYHQGTLYKPTVYAIPFFLELLANPHVEDKAELLHFLATIARGGRFGTPAHFYTWEYSPEHLDVVEQQGITPYPASHESQARKALWKGYAIYLRFLEDKDPTIRHCVMDLLGSFRRESATVVPLFLRLLRTEQDAVMRATLVWLLYGLLPRKHLETKAYLRPYLSLTEPPLVRFVTALAFAEMERDALPQETFDILISIFQEPATVEKGFREIPCSGWGVEVAIAGLFPYIGRERTKFLLPFLLDHLQSTSAPFAEQYLTRAALFLAFSEPLPPHLCNEEQRKTLQIIMEVAYPGEWGGNGNVSVELKLFGFPGGREPLRDYIAKISDKPNP